MSSSRPSWPIYAVFAASPDRLVGAALVLALAAGSGWLASARTLEAVQRRGTVTLCGHSNALPFSSRKASNSFGTAPNSLQIYSPSRTPTIVAER